MSTDWLGILLSIPVGIGTALVTPWVQRKFEERGKKRALVRSRNAQAELKEVTYYKDHPQEFTQYLVHVAIKTTFIGALMGIASGFSFVVGQLLSTRGMSGDFQMLQTVFYASGQMIALIASLIIVNICRPALTIWTRVRNYDEYSAAVGKIARPAATKKQSPH